MMAQNAPHSGAHGCADTSQTPPDSGLRTCVVCRQQAAKDTLLPWVWAAMPQGPGAIWLAPKAIPGNKRFYLCMRAECLAGLSSRGVSRALKRNVTFEGQTLVQGITRASEVAQKRITEILGLARRQGTLVLGSDGAFRAAEEAMHGGRGKGGVLVAAQDLAPKTLAKVKRLQGITISDSARLGGAIGVASAGVVWIKPGHHARELSYWLRAGEEIASGLCLLTQTRNGSRRTEVQSYG